jgi:hypothetical protein
LRTALARHARQYAAEEKLSFYESLGASPTVLFEPFADGARHGNFLDDSYAAILRHPAWAARLLKTHSRKNALPEEKRSTARELDSSNSSDALLMNILCYPGVLASALGELLGCGPSAELVFGAEGDVPFEEGGIDQTSLDARMGRLILEAKLTEPDFTFQRAEVVESYAGLQKVFEADRLPRRGTEYCSYQLIRNVLAAHHHGYSFTLVCDARRPDLLRAWWIIHSAIRQPDLRCRCSFLLWQEAAQLVPAPLRDFLRRKYGIC